VALKGVAPGLVHKSDAGAVKLGLPDAAALRRAWEEIAASVARHHGAAPEGCMVQEMARGGAELIIGIRRDPQFGPVVLAGSGGILVELLRDLELGMAPVSHGQAVEMLRTLRLAPVLDGVRGQPPLDIEAAAKCIVGMSWLAADLGERLSDAEINPLVLRERGQGALAVDVRATIAAL
jgi:acetyl-CoA synthetase (ADP-forming)